jgi:hypothetical protein
MKVRVFKDGDKTIHAYHCPGCGYGHMWDSRWTWNGDVEKPTVSPSLLQTVGTKCHCFIREGKIQFLVDCGHALAGKTVEMPDWDEEKS